MSDRCPVREYCPNKACEGVDQVITQDNCGCKICIQRSIEEVSTLTPELARKRCERACEIRPLLNSSGDLYDSI